MQSLLNSYRIAYFSDDQKLYWVWTSSLQRKDSLLNILRSADLAVLARSNYIHMSCLAARLVMHAFLSGK
jgi:hypothetical protein